ncbi:Transcription initiation factor IIA subunit 1 [Strongyloides ratti]|uniref:Transcription initiation factor IIA subunit 1 n=1 Tax=Strongyloides ratti TaxID=34506 RepID=A0A090LMQ5_STRRB|nr:Transcription initiation factor IIA subunit 1 [Strongyloides ratti]CEF68805.1 Transcription initiation factor IIA subunit 1 [Strongyloides ratti]
MSAASNTVEEIYLSVVNDVIAQCKESFLDDNVDLEVLTQLKDEWWGKLKQSGCVDYSPPQRLITNQMIRPAPTSNMIMGQNIAPSQSHVKQPIQQQQQQQQQPQQIVSNVSGMLTTNTTNGNSNPNPPTSQMPNAIFTNLQHLNSQTNQQTINNLLAQRQNGQIPQQIIIQPSNIPGGGQLLYLNTTQNIGNLSNLLTTNAGTISCGIATQGSNNFANMLQQTPLRNDGTSMNDQNAALLQNSSQQQLFHLLQQRTIVPQTNNGGSINQGGNIPQLDGAITLNESNNEVEDINVKKCKTNTKNALSKEKNVKALKKAIEKKFIIQLDGSHTGHMSDSDSDDDEGNEDGLIQYANEDTEGGGDDNQEDPLNSEDDQSDDEDVVKLFESDNIIMCQFEKVSRTRTKWKFNLKDGIMHINGKDYCFQKCSGEAEW